MSQPTTEGVDMKDHLSARAWAHLHLPRLRSGATLDVISLKVPGERIEYVSAVELRDVEFKVHEAGRQRCIRENVRNVHAWVVGSDPRKAVGELKYIIDTRAFRKAVYDPWKGDTFVDAETLKPVRQAREAILIGKDVYYRPEGCGAVDAGDWDACGNCFDCKPRV